VVDCCVADTLFAAQFWSPDLLLIRLLDLCCCPVNLNLLSLFAAQFWLPNLLLIRRLDSHATAL
jgi:hypothetical protein